MRRFRAIGNKCGERPLIPGSCSIDSGRSRDQVSRTRCARGFAAPHLQAQADPSGAVVKKQVLRAGSDFRDRPSPWWGWPPANLHSILGFDSECRLALPLRASAASIFFFFSSQYLEFRVKFVFCRRAFTPRRRRGRQRTRTQTRCIMPFGCPLASRRPFRFNRRNRVRPVGKTHFRSASLVTL